MRPAAPPPGRCSRAERGSSVSGSEIASLQLQAAQIEADIAAASRTRAAAPRNSAGVAVDSKLAGARSRAELELQSAQAELAEKQARLTNEHPDVRRALRRVSDAEAAMRRAEAAVAAWVPPPRRARSAAGERRRRGLEGAADRVAVSPLRRALSDRRGTRPRHPQVGGGANRQHDGGDRNRLDAAQSRGGGSPRAPDPARRQAVPGAARGDARRAKGRAESSSSPTRRSSRSARWPASVSRSASWGWGAPCSWGSS